MAENPKVQRSPFCFLKYKLEKTTFGHKNDTSYADAEPRGY